MNIPGFTAEASCYRNSAHYQVGAMLPGLRQGGGVVPARADSWAQCMGDLCFVSILGVLTICGAGGHCKSYVEV